jgi:RNA polymerase sigma factor (sigma-70 family)
MNLFTSSFKTVAASTDRPQLNIDDFFSEHWEKLCGVVYRLTGDWDEAQDIVMETFIQLYNQPPKDNRNLNGWLYRVATNRGLNILRANQRRKHYESKQVYMDSDQNQSNDLAEKIEHKQEQELVRDALSAMNNRSARLLVLRYSGFSYKELARIFNISKNSIGTLLVRAQREFETTYKKLNRYEEEV